MLKINRRIAKRGEKKAVAFHARKNKLKASV